MNRWGHWKSRQGEGAMEKPGGLRWVALLGTVAACAGATVPKFHQDQTCDAGALTDSGACAPPSSIEQPGTDAGDDGTISTGEDASDHDGTTGPDGTPRDAGPDTASDPCPSGPPASYPDMDCDQTCSDAGTSFCATVKCGPTVSAIVGFDNGFRVAFPYRIRTPEGPGIDPNCAAQCPAGGYVYGIGVKTNTAYTGSSFIVKVGAPWEIIQGSQVPYCSDTNSLPPRQCAWFANLSPTPIYIMTKDPNAPARDILFDLQPDGTKCSQ
jgi:hypothetical protein